jgi:type I restriction enzyme R subunit
MEDEVYSLSEEDIKLRYITPAIMEKGWSVKDITMETKVKLTDGRFRRYKKYWG